MWGISNDLKGKSRLKNKQTPNSQKQRGTSSTQQWKRIHCRQTSFYKDTSEKEVLQYKSVKFPNATSSQGLDPDAFQIDRVKKKVKKR